MNAEAIAKQLFPGATPAGDGWWLTRCCGPEHPDKNPSLSLKDGKNGKILVKCHRGCEGHVILAELRRRGLIEDNKRMSKKTSSTGLTVQELADAKGFDLDYLEGFGVEDAIWNGKPAVKIPYFDVDGNLAATHYRVAKDGKGKFRWDGRPTLYGLDRLDTNKKSCTLVEGESDCWTLWKNGFNCLGIPGASSWNEERDAQRLAGFEKIYVVKEPDKGGEKVIRTLAKSSIVDRLHIIELDGFKDPSELYLSTRREPLENGLTYANADPFHKLFRRAQRKAAKINPEDYCQVEPEIAALNQKHAVVLLGGKCVILNETIDPTFNRAGINFSSPASFKDFYANQKVSDGNREVKLGHYWLTHADRRQYDGVVFSPSQDVPGYYNLWRGFSVELREGSCACYLAHIRDVIASGNEEVYEYLLNWLADLFQNPGRRPGVAIVLRGDQGVGKGAMVSPLLIILGSHGLHISLSKRLVGSFNNHLKDAILVFSDEAFWAGDKGAEGVLKALVTEDTFSIEPKGVDCFTVKNHIRLIVATNNSWAVPAGLEERRFFALDVSPVHMQDTEYFKNLFDEMGNGGREALLHFLLNRDISGVDLRKFPKTDALLEQKHFSMTPVQKFWFEILMRGALTKDTDCWDMGEVSKDDLHDFFVEFTGKTGQRHRATSTELGMGLKQITQVKSVVRNMKGLRTPAYQFPALEKCRELFEIKLKQKITWPGIEMDETSNNTKKKKEQPRRYGRFNQG